MTTTQRSNFPIPPELEDVQQQLQPLLDAILEAVQEGTLHVQEYSNWQAEPIDFALAPNLVRHKAKQSLISSGQEAEDEGEEFETEQIPNNGICIAVPGFAIRVLKSSDEGTIPSPGTSMTRKNFYNQLQALFDFAIPTWGVIVHWQVDADYNLLRLSIALPLRITKDENNRQVIETQFDEPFWIRPTQQVTIIDETVAVTAGDIEGIQVEELKKTAEDPRETE